jgi:hypothetical protein
LCHWQTNCQSQGLVLLSPLSGLKLLESLISPLWLPLPEVGQQ